MVKSIEPATPIGVPPRYLHWTPVILGALVATALSSILLAFGATIGLGISSTAPTWRDASAALWILSGLYLIIQAALSFGVGGYLAGRTSVGLAAADSTEIEHRDGLHGLAAWALAVVLGVALAALLGSATLTRSGNNMSSARTSAAEPLLSYELDRLFRPSRRPANVDLSQERAEAIEQRVPIRSAIIPNPVETAAWPRESQPNCWRCVSKTGAKYVFRNRGQW